MANDFMQVKIKNAEQVARLTKRFLRPHVQTKLDHALFKSAQVAEEGIKKAMDFYVYSKPFAPTYQRTGFMRASTRIKGFRTGKKGFARIGPTADYAIFVHEGRGGNRKYGERPFVSKAADMIQRDLQKIVKDTGEEVVTFLVAG